MNRRKSVLIENRQGAATEERNGGSKTPFALMLGKGSPAAHPLTEEGRLSNLYLRVLRFSVFDSISRNLKIFVIKFYADEVSVRV